MKRYTAIFFACTAIFTIVCQCSMLGRTQKLAGRECLFSGTYDTDTGLHDGTFDCKNPDGSMLTCPYTGAPVTNSKIRLYNQSSAKMTDVQFWAALGCVPESQAPTALPTQTATATPAAAESIQGIAAPLLTGDVTACNPNEGFINFKLVDGAPAMAGNDVLVMMNGIQVNCIVPANNASVLSCALPNEIVFPVQVSVAIGDSIANQFSYNGVACVYTEPTKENPEGDDTPDTTQPPTPCLGDVCS